jgi:hypothetical protein
MRERTIVCSCILYFSFLLNTDEKARFYMIWLVETSVGELEGK